MVFSSIPAYIDPSNWQQQQTHGSDCVNSYLSLPQTSQTVVSSSPSHQLHGSIRNGSMSERARLANIPMPETALRCPRCESTNTKFCYFNNYSLSQPRHFCKSCRRYWTRGGALRNVPVGGGCRRNKRIKPSSSKSSANNDREVTNSSAGMTSGGVPPQILPPFRFLSPLSQFSDTFSNEMGLNSSGISAPMVSSNDQINFHAGGAGLGSLFSTCSNETWKLQQFPFLNSIDSSPAGIFPFQGCEQGFMICETSQSDHLKHKVTGSTLNLPSVSVKMEDNANQLHLPKQIFGGIQVNPDTWNTSSTTAVATASPWTELSSFSSSIDDNTT